MEGWPGWVGLGGWLCTEVACLCWYAQFRYNYNKPPHTPLEALFTLGLQGYTPPCSIHPNTSHYAARNYIQNAIRRCSLTDIIYTKILLSRDTAPDRMREPKMLPSNLIAWGEGVQYPAPRCLPHLVFSTFDVLPHPVTAAFVLSAPKWFRG